MRSAPFLLGAIFFIGCALPPHSARLLNSPPPDVKPEVKIADVPFFSQEEFQCGPASLAMALGWSGKNVPPDVLSARVFLPGRNGTLQSEILSGASRECRFAYIIDPSLESLIRQLDAGFPVVVLQNLGLSWYEVWHYAVVVGYDLENSEFILHSGSNAELRLPFSTFERTWARSSYWGVLVLPAHLFPIRPKLENTLSALSLLERSKCWNEMEQFSKTALLRWPKDFQFRVGLGNALHRQGKLSEAEAIFSALKEEFPDSDAVGNNLAEVLVERGQLDRALAEAQRAVDLRGRFNETCLKTLGSIEQRCLKQRQLCRTFVRISPDNFR